MYWCNVGRCGTFAGDSAKFCALFREARHGKVSTAGSGFFPRVTHLIKRNTLAVVCLGAKEKYEKPKKLFKVYPKKCQIYISSISSAKTNPRLVLTFYCIASVC